MRTEAEIREERTKWEKTVGDGSDETWMVIIDTLNWALGDAQNLSQYEEV